MAATKKDRRSLSLNEDIGDNMDFVSGKLGVSVNALVNISVAKFLTELGLVDIKPDTVKELPPIKETKYCKLLKQVIVKSGEFLCALERIEVNETGEQEIRFAYYKETANGNQRMIMRPLDVDEKTLLKLFINGIAEGVFGDEFRKKLKSCL